MVVVTIDAPMSITANDVNFYTIKTTAAKYCNKKNG